MKLLLKRRKYTNKSTIGDLNIVDSHLYADSEGVVTLEDTKREHKVYCETCIPAGTYILDLRKDSKKYAHFYERYPGVHRGMIWLRGVPGFTWIYIHTGNKPEDTDGCILVGLTDSEDYVSSSRLAYEAIYSGIADAIENEGCTLTVED